MTLIERILNESDQRRQRAEPAPRLCACCGETGEFDPFAVVHDRAHHIALEREFGGSCCLDCLDSFAPCVECGEVKYATEIDEDGLCKSCAYDAEFAQRRGW